MLSRSLELIVRVFIFARAGGVDLSTTGRISRGFSKAGNSTPSSSPTSSASMTSSMAMSTPR
jgi:hypothetical protein